MLLENFYKINSLETIDNKNYIATIFINKEHEVFKGHFPDNPVMPGVCMMQIIKEIIEQITDSNLFIQTLSNVKFMALINPFVTPELKLELELSTTEEGFIKVKNTTYFNETIALKLSSVYRKLIVL